jgi:uncharacterized protein (DUF488 family)
MNSTVYTVGHSTHPIVEFVSILHAYNVEIVVDVRTIAGSHHNPQFNEAALGEDLCRHGIEYMHLKDLGGLRHTTKGSINTAWKNPSFRGYADYMQTPAFIEGLLRLIQIAQDKIAVIMCAEAVPWRCHRSLISDALLIRGIHVEDIMSEKVSRPHVLTPWAKVDQGTITYPEVGRL